MFDGALQDLIDEFGRLPGIGPRSASRLAFHVLESDAADVAALADALTQVKERVTFCERCFYLAEAPLCSICSAGNRNETVICLVAEPRDVIAIERTREFNGLYHVLGGVISPLDGIGPDELHIRELVQRIDEQSVREVIVALSPTAEGDATTSYISRLISPLTTVSRIAQGLPVGGDLDYADEVTLGRALAGRATA